MRVKFSGIVASTAGLLVAGAVLAQDGSTHGHVTESPMELPAACRTVTMPEMPDMNMQSLMESMAGEAQQAMMEAMMRTQGPMMQGVMGEDPDVAFACAMIPHHQSAIDMAEAELQYGDAGPMKALAEDVIEAQKREIAELTRWLEEQGAQ